MRPVLAMSEFKKIKIDAFLWECPRCHKEFTSPWENQLEQIKKDHMEAHSEKDQKRNEIQAY